MLEPVIELLQTVPWIWILAISLFFTFLENIFPPAPCDTIIVFTGTLVGIGTVGFAPLLVSSTAGSVLGFMVMFIFGRTLGNRLLDSKRFKFINRENLEKPEKWFNKYGYYLIIANRFLSGTRAVISFFAGISKLSLRKTLFLSGLSALIWNALLIGLGVLLGANWRLADHYLSLYGQIILPIIILILLVIAVRWFIMQQNNRNNNKNKVNNGNS